MKMYLLFEWTEEREAKIHHGIYSTPEKAREAAALFYAAEDAAGAILWIDGYGEKSCDEEDNGYEILEFEVDIVEIHRWSANGEHTVRREEV